MLSLTALTLASCGTSEPESSESAASTPATSTAVTGMDTGLFLDGALVGEPTTEDCTLSGGAETTCYRMTVAGYPVDHEVGPFCPPTITDSAENGGIWFDGENQYDLDGKFIEDLAETYDDDTWRMYDEDGNVLVTETQEEFEAAARPDVDPALQNHCIEGRVDWLENGEPITTEVVIPTTPVDAAQSADSQGILGITLDGVRIDASAPVDAILGAYTIAAFDDCGGHFNPTEATTCMARSAAPRSARRATVTPRNSATRSTDTRYTARSRTVRHPTTSMSAMATPPSPPATTTTRIQPPTTR
ncbi:hypothetical protein [Rhodococcus sp. BS-15]|uniref:hypothetical protein n=1 Tax=Rhodococcus sp. BS-15 TaxID=1304954 RepID=UPI000B0A8842|nr:hypothetical protein [Rhodococcus sp. BS-15]